MEQATATSVDPAVQRNLETFDDLDFNVFSKRDWAGLDRSHSQDILVHWPDGHTTRGMEQHVKDLDAMFVFAPDTRISEHPIRIGSGEWTSVMGWMEGTFTEPMPTPNGPVPPTGKAFRIPMCTIGRWRDGVMVEEYLFWDNATFMKQIGLSH